MEIIATPANGWKDTEERRRKEKSAENAAKRQASLFALKRFNGVDDLVARIERLMKSQPNIPCLRSLEIRAHGNPVDIDDFQVNDAGAWGTKLRTLTWCDQASVYLSGCNTGLSRRPGLTPSGPIAKELRDSMRFTPGSFEVRLTVYGTAGYKYGSHAEGNTRVTREVTSSFLFWSTVRSEAFPGSRDASGAKAWIAFKNW
jgi:hypothetical protein